MIDPRHSDAILDALGRHLEEFAEWEVCDWQDLSVDTPLRTVATAIDDAPRSHVKLTGSFEEFLAAQPKDLRRNLRRYNEKAQAIGSVQFEVTVEADPALISALVDLHGARWRRSGEGGTIESNGAAGFLREVAGVLANDGMVRIFTLYFQENVAAILLALVNHTTIFSYLSTPVRKYGDVYNSHVGDVIC